MSALNSSLTARQPCVSTLTPAKAEYETITIIVSGSVSSVSITYDARETLIRRMIRGLNKRSMS